MSAGTNPIQDPAAELAAWYAIRRRIAAECAPLVEQERAMRARLFGHFFPAPKEGTNTFTLPDGYNVKGTYPFERKVDPAAVLQLRGMDVGDLPEAVRTRLGLADADDATPVVVALRLDVDKLLNWEPKLVVKEYRNLTAEQTAIFDRCLTCKPGSISLEVTPPSTRAAPPTAAGFGPAA